MTFIQEFLKRAENLHHAYIIEGNKENVVPELVGFLEKERGVVTRGNPDFLHQDFETFGIADAHAARALQSRRAIHDVGPEGEPLDSPKPLGRRGSAPYGAGKYFIISFLTITAEAQNALLKIFEEPTAGTHFFIITPKATQLFPTLLSRAIVISATPTLKPYDVLNETLSEQFLKSSSVKRLSLIQPIIKEKDKYAAQQFLNILEVMLWRTENRHTRTKDAACALNEVMDAQRHLAARSPSLKLILEHLALVIPHP